MKISRVVIIGAGIAILVVLLVCVALPLCTGLGFHLWDSAVHFNDQEGPRPPYLKGNGPGQPGVGKPVEPPAEKPLDPKKPDVSKKDA